MRVDVGLRGVDPRRPGTDVAQRLPDLRPDELGELTVVAPPGLLAAVTTPEGIF